MMDALNKAVCVLVWSVVALGIAIAALFLGVLQPGGSGALASIQLADGSEYRVTQRFNWSVEPYTVSFYMRSADGRWGWCYIDHEASRWRDVAISYDADLDTIEVTERGVRRAVLDRSRSVFSLENGSIIRELPAPQAAVSQPEFASVKR